MEKIEAKAFRTFIRMYSLLKSERLSANIKLTLHVGSTLTSKELETSMIQQSLFNLYFSGPFASSGSELIIT
jgi:hypothetical protein